MAESSTSYVSQLVKHMKFLTAVTGEETLLELAVEHVADGVAEEIGLKQGKVNEIENLILQKRHCTAIC